MAKRGGFPGGMGGMNANNLNNLMKQAQKMQRQMEEQQAKLETSEYTGKAGGGAVSVVVSGKKEIRSLTIEPEVVDPEDVEMLQDLIIAAFNEAFRQVDEVTSANMNQLTGGMGGLNGLF